MLFIQQGINGFLFSNKSECIEWMKKVTNKQYMMDLKSIIHNASVTAYNDFSEEIYSQKILSIYQKILHA